VVKQIVDGAQQDVAAEPGSGAAPRDPEVLSHQVVVGDIPLAPPGFQSRASVLDRLDRAGARVSVIHTTTGLQGRGATQLAAAYARAKLAAGWRLVAWVNAADIGTMQAGLAGVAEAAGLTEDDSGRPIADAGQAVQHLLETDGDRRLLVFDDVADPEALSPVLPAEGTAQVLIVSTRHTNQNLATAVLADVFGADEAQSFLRSRTGLDDEAGAAEVAAVLGHLPLALALAAPLIRGVRHGYARYLDRLQTVPADVSLEGDDNQRYPHGVARAILLSLAAVRAADKMGTCSRVMSILAVLSAAGVRRELLHVAGRAGVLAGGGRRVPADQVDRVLAWLADQSLLTFSLDGQTVMVHRLVAQVIRDGLARQRRLGAVYWVAASVLEAHAIAVAGRHDRPAVRRIPQQVTALLDHTAELPEGVDEELAGILLRLRFLSLYHLVELGGSAPQAIAIGEPLTADLERLLGAGHPDTLSASNSLAAAYLAADRVADAIPLFEEALAALVSQSGPDHPDSLTLQNNLASVYQDAGRAGEAIQLYEQTLAVRERVLGVDHPGTLTSRGNLAAAYLAAGRAAEAIPLLEQTVADRERVLGPGHPDTHTSRRNLAQAYQDAGRAAEAVPLLEQISADRPRTVRPDSPRIQLPRAPAPAPKAHPSGIRRPPAGPARPVLPSGVRRPPADQARPARPDHIAGGRARPSGPAFPGPAQGAPPADAGPDREVLAAILAKNPAGLATAYDRYAAGLYGYCHWMLHDPAAAAESVQDTFVLAAATLGGQAEAVKLRPLLFALARSESRRRAWPPPAVRDEGDAPSRRPAGNQPADAAPRAADPPRAEAAPGPADATRQFRRISEPAGESADLADATMLFHAFSEPADVVPGPNDATIQYSPLGEPAAAFHSRADATMQFSVVGQVADATVQFRVIREPASVMDSMADFGGYLGQAELGALIRSVLVDMKPREREVVELNFRHELFDDDLAVALGVSVGKAQALAARTGDRLEKSLAALRTALAGRQACPVMGELLADWDGQLTEQTRDLVAWHMEQCQICVDQARGALRPTVLRALLPLPPLPAELREKVLNLCSSTAEEAVAYRRRVVRRAESTWAPLFSQAARRVSWAGIRAYPGAAIATAAVVLWVAAAVTATLLTFAGPRAAHAQPDPAGSSAAHAQGAAAGAGISVSPTAAPTTAAARRSATVRPSAVFTQPSASVPSRFQPRPSLTPSKSPSAKPSKSPSPSTSPSKPASPSPSASSSPSPSPTA
jgi:DNA-directed RNA polymerase specialized sigma24 family protein